MNFETWTNTIGLLGHTGFGLGFRKTDGAYAKTEWVISWLV
jgi:OOP family OmpA-OmpF porin